MLQRERAREGKGWGHRGGESLFCTKPNPNWNDSTVPGASRVLGTGMGTAGVTDGTKGHGTFWDTQTCERTGRGWALRASTAGWRLSPLPGTAGMNPQGQRELLSPQECEFSWSRARPGWLWDRDPPNTNPEFLLHKDSHSAGTLGCSISVCSHPLQKKNEKLQARSLCFRLFSTKRLGNKAHSFPSRESERVNFRKQNLKT